tara:strand:- start:357 stop:1391 length:1035 start_codon:yes stop_codon:yes gene_type:complete
MAIPNVGANQVAEESSLSSWAGPYVTDMLGRGEALASMPYQAYMGPLTAGASTLQDTAFQGIGALSAPTNMGGFNPQSFTGAGYAAPTAAQAAAGEMGAYTPASGNVLQQYMSPYLEGALQPQYDAAQRQSEIQAQKLQSQFGKAGAYGGSRQGIAEAELQRGLLDRMSGITGTGYQTAFEQAQKQFNTEQDRQMTAQQRTNQYGMDVLGAQQDAGSVQRAIEQQGITADMAQFEQERDDPKSNVLFMQSLLQGLPLETQSYSYSQPTGLESLAGGVSGVKSTLDVLSEYMGGNTGTGPTGGYTGPDLTQAQAQAMQNQYQVNLTTMAPKEAMEAAMKQAGFVI